ncbi:MAG TPA: hypothetical protein VM802_10050 [Chitinophaga sp.]|uniref:hypothetical protein n=1 Tax=Chitinophaga sp. TaxID=1869181 RepID=UPI002C37EE52|nr:hypothetical protein [Chitinophaga sp.]HVI45206.1 hypothetical protein [Chitinophaga sp.]
MSKTKLLIKTLEACEKHEFDKVVKSYLKEVQGFKRVVLTDGKDDVGLDMQNGELFSEKIQYQLTTQKSNTPQEKSNFKTKITEDLEKARVNNIDYGYSNILFFFYSQTLTQKSIREFEKLAISSFGINLVLVDANRLAEESEDYLELQRSILNTIELDHTLTDKSLFPNEEKNLIFDLFSFGKPSDFKLQIVESYVLQILFEKKECSQEEIITKCKEKFKVNDIDIFIQKLFARLQSSKKITKNPEKLNFILTTEEQNRIKSLTDIFNKEETAFVVGINNILSTHNQQQHLTDYIQELKNIYSNNFSSDLQFILESKPDADLFNISRSFLTFITNNLDKKYDPKQLALRLFEYCQTNTFLQKFCAGKVFGRENNLDKIETYVNTKKKIYIDTPIAIHALCYFYEQTATYKNYFYQLTKSLLEFCKKNKIKLFLIENYAWEVQSQVRDALNLIPFTELPNFEKLGRSRNPFFNYFLHIKNNYDSQLNFSDFFSNLNLSSYDIHTKHNQLIQDYLLNVGVHVEKIENHYDIDEPKFLFQEEMTNAREKTFFALNNDARLIQYLSDPDPDVQPLQPIFLTWDKSFFKVLKRYFNSNFTGKRWFLMTPGKFIDQYSLLQFTLDGESLTNELLALISDDLITTAHSLLDSIQTILNPRDEIGRQYLNKLAEIRDNEIYRIKENEVMPPEDLEGEAVIDDVFYKLTRYYLDDNQKLISFKRLFTQKEYINDIIQILDNAVNNTYSLNRIADTVYIEFNTLIDKLNSSINHPNT